MDETIISTGYSAIPELVVQSGFFGAADGGAVITAGPTGAAGTTFYSASITDGTVVTLVGPDTITADSTRHGIWRKWYVNGAASIPNKTIAFIMSGDVTYHADFTPLSWTLTCQSTPLSGVAITGIGIGGGTTEFVNSNNWYDNRTYTMTAPMLASEGGTGYGFVRWTLNGTAQPAMQNTLTFMNNDGLGRLAVAEYAVIQRTLSVQSTPVTDVSITGTVAGATNYMTSADDNSVVSLVAPATFAVGSTDYTFSQWMVDGTAQVSNQTTLSFTINADTTAVAGYAMLPPQLAWAKRAGGSGIDEHGRGIAALPDGSVLVTGYFQGSATFGAGEPNETTLISAGSYDVFVARYYPDGSLVWVKRSGGSSEDCSYGIAALSDGSALVTGLFFGSATFGAGEPNETTLISAGGSDVFVAKYYPDGSLAWAKRDGGSDHDDSSGIAALPDGSALVTGGFSGSATFGAGEPNETTLISAGFNDVFVARYGSAPIQHTLIVQSTPVTGIVITGSAAGATNYTTMLDSGADITLTATTTFTEYGTDYFFTGWTVNDVPQSPGVQTVVFALEEDTTAIAEYEIVKRTLNVQSTPSTGVDIYGTHPGITNYSTEADDNSMVSLTAPAMGTITGLKYTFVRWIVDGVQKPAGVTTVTFDINGNSTVIAKYARSKKLVRP